MRIGKAVLGQRIREILATTTVGAAANLKARYRVRAIPAKPLMATAGVLGLAALSPFFAIGFWPPLYIALACVALAVVFVVSLTIALSARAYARHLPLVDQHIRDMKAAELYGHLKGGERPHAYSLYLRPFKSTNDLRLVDPREAEKLAQAASMLGVIASEGAAGHSPRLTRAPDMPVTVAADAPHLEFEAAIMASLATRAPLVCLGKKLEHVGAGRIEVADDDWQRAVKTLTASADLIVICPSRQTGTLWEIEHLAQDGLIDRTVFIDMPEGGYRGGRWKQNREWAAIAAVLAKYGYDLPSETSDGLFFYFGKQKTPLLATHVGKLEISRLGDFFDAVVAHKDKAAQPQAGR